MNIGLVCPYEWTVPGGVGNHVRALAAELRRAGHRVDVLAPAERPVTEPGFVGLGGSVAVPSQRVGGPDRSSAPAPWSGSAGPCTGAATTCCMSTSRCRPAPACSP